MGRWALSIEALALWPPLRSAAKNAERLPLDAYVMTPLNAFRTVSSLPFLSLIRGFARPMAAASLLGCAALLSACGGDSHDDAPAPVIDASSVQRSADAAITSGLVGVAVDHVTVDRTDSAVAGLRRLGGSEKVLATDAFQIGSTTKAMVAALAGRLVERGTIAWTTTLAEALPDLAPAMLPAYRSVTFEQLLNHRGGVLGFQEPADGDRFFAALTAFDGPLPDTRLGRERFFAAWLLAQQPPAGVVPGRDFLYSNAGYALAALMMEVRSGQGFNALFDAELVRPLGLTVTWHSVAASFTGRPNGHTGEKGKLTPIVALDADQADWFDVLAPSGGGLTLTPDSYATWVRWHLKALQGQTTPLAAGYLQRIKSLANGDYALGWVGAELDGRPLLFHNGEDHGFSSLLLLDQKGRSASFAFTNAQSDGEDWVMTALTQRLLDVERAMPPR